jgi:hypothetical protein
MDGEGQKEEAPQEETIALSLTYKEAAAFHMFYFLGALLVNGEYSRVTQQTLSLRAFCDMALTDDDVVEIRRKATELVDNIPEEARKKLGLLVLPEKHDQDTT